MLHPGVRTTEEELDAALAAALSGPELPSISKVAYHRDLDLFLFEISNGRRIAVPREDIWAVRNATPEQAANFVSEPPHADIWWPDMDEGLHIDGLLEGRYGNDAWMDYVRRRIVPVAA